MPDEDMRNGRRARAAEWTSIKPAGGELKNKARARPRKETIICTARSILILSRQWRCCARAASSTQPPPLPLVLWQLTELLAHRAFGVRLAYNSLAFLSA